MRASGQGRIKSTATSDAHSTVGDSTTQKVKVAVAQEYRATMSISHNTATAAMLMDAIHALADPSAMPATRKRVCLEEAEARLRALQVSGMESDANE